MLAKKKQHHPEKVSVRYNNQGVETHFTAWTEIQDVPDPSRHA